MPHRLAPDRGYDGLKECGDFASRGSRQRYDRCGRQCGGPGATENTKRSSALLRRDGRRESLFYNDWGAGQPVLFTHAWGLNADI